jgi:hypothetical protein
MIGKDQVVEASVPAGVEAPGELESWELSKRQKLGQLLEQRGLPACYGRFPKREVREDDDDARLERTASYLVKCVLCEHRELCFRHSLLFHLDHLFHL